MRKGFLTLLMFCVIVSAHAQFQKSPWWGWADPDQTPQWWEMSPTIYRSGSIGIYGPWGGAVTNKGILFGSDMEYQNIWHHWGNYPNGLTRADGTKLNLSVGQNSGEAPLILAGDAGVALSTSQGALLVHQNGIISMGLKMSETSTAMTALSQKPNNYGGLTASDYILYVRRGIVTEKIKVAAIENWPDYVFQKHYNLLPLSMVETHIKEKGHLPNIPSAAVVEKEGIELSDMAKRQQEKIEELFLHLIDMDKRLKALEAENTQLKAELDNLKK